MTTIDSKIYKCLMYKKNMFATRIKYKMQKG